eukprot:jgi/Botrbrau1/12879/Bobra.0188s0021.1
MAALPLVLLKARIRSEQLGSRSKKVLDFSLVLRRKTSLPTVGGSPAKSGRHARQRQE